MPPKDDINVSVSDDTGYRAENVGPEADTHAFHHATPAPAQRAEFQSDGPPSINSPRNSAPRLPQIPIQKTVVPPEPHHDRGEGLSFPALLAGASIVSVSILIAGVVFIMVVTKPPPDAPPDEPAVQEVDGIEVHKTFKDPGVQ